MRAARGGKLAPFAREADMKVLVGTGGDTLMEALRAEFTDVEFVSTGSPGETVDRIPRRGRLLRGSSFAGGVRGRRAPALDYST